MSDLPSDPLTLQSLLRAAYIRIAELETEVAGLRLQKPALQIAEQQFASAKDMQNAIIQGTVERQNQLVQDVQIEVARLRGLVRRLGGDPDAH